VSQIGLLLGVLLLAMSGSRGAIGAPRATEPAANAVAAQESTAATSARQPAANAVAAPALTAATQTPVLTAATQTPALTVATQTPALTAATQAPPQHAPNPVVVPPYSATIRAAHRVHAEQANLLCKDCHADVERSTETRDWLGPSAALCDKCHEPKHANLPAGSVAQGPDCAVCHLTDPEQRSLHLTGSALERHPTAHLQFSHAKHAKRHIGCAQCHGLVAKSRDALGSERLPRKPSCVRCHRGEGRIDGQAMATCVTCHESSGGLIRTRFEGQVLVPGLGMQALVHGPDFRLTHGTVAGNEPRQCQGCHTERQCQDCHDGRLRPRNIHPGDWLSAHAIASKQGNDCSSCHRLQSFCLSCHERVGLSSSGAAAAMRQRGSFHPSATVWTTGPRGPRHHAVAARRNLSECVSCHQERDCVRCHATNSLGGLGALSPYGSGHSPHPPSFAANCRGYFERNPRPCLSCHRPEDSAIQRCR